MLRTVINFAATTMATDIDALRTSSGVALQDWIAIGIAFLALLLSVWSAVYASKKAEGIADRTIQSQRDELRANNYARLHELLVDPKAARGRRSLFKAAAKGKFPRRNKQRDSQEWDDINYSLALYDTLGGYIRRGLVDAELVLNAWHHPLQDIAEPVRLFMEHRQRSGVTQPWSFLMYLLTLASQHQCTCPVQPHFSSGASTAAPQSRRIDRRRSCRSPKEGQTNA